MMVVVGKKVETLIARLAQKSPAPLQLSLILATQTIGDIITGLIKARYSHPHSFRSLQN